MRVEVIPIRRRDFEDDRHTPGELAKPSRARGTSSMDDDARRERKPILKLLDAANPDLDAAVRPLAARRR